MLLGMTAGLRAQQQETGPAARRVIIFVWDGLRADDLTPDITPNYFALARSGVVFADHHAVYPTFTMMNSASIATGTYPGVHGFYGNVVYAPSAKGKNAKGADIDFSAPAFIEDFGVVEAVRDSYQGRLTLVSTMLQAAQAKGLTTAAIGKFGAAFIQDYKRGGIILDEDAAMPLAFAKELQQAGYPLPRNSGNAYEAGALTLAKDNGDPTAPIPIQRLKDGQTGNPLDRSGALSRRGFAYLTDVFVNYILPNKKPDLTIFWSKEPDATSHAYGPGTYNSIDATRMNDEILGRVVEKLRQLGWEESTDIIITQDHNHSTVSGDVAHYPLRAIVDRGVGAHDPHGYSVSGFVRTAELLTRDGLKAYDGAGVPRHTDLVRHHGRRHAPLPQQGRRARKRLRPGAKIHLAELCGAEADSRGGRRGRRERGQRLSVRAGWQHRHGQGRRGEPAEPPAVRRDLRERQVWRDRRDAAHEPHQDREQRKRPGAGHHRQLQLR